MQGGVEYKSQDCGTLEEERFVIVKGHNKMLLGKAGQFLFLDLRDCYTDIHFKIFNLVVLLCLCTFSVHELHFTKTIPPFKKVNGGLPWWYSG